LSQLSRWGDYHVMPPSEKRTSSELIRASVNDPNAFEILFVRYACDVRAWLESEVRDLAVANDLLAETFAQAWRSRQRFKGPEPDDGLAWIYGIARNLLRRHHKRGRVDSRARQRLGMRVELIEDDQSQAILARLAAAGLHARLGAALKGLPEGQQRALDARIVRELDYPSVAAELECNEPNARALVSRGLRKLNRTLDGAES